MYKNFSYIFGLGALLLLAACDSGNKQSKDDKQNTKTESQEIVTKQKEKTKSIEEISLQDQVDKQKSVIKERDIYSDINSPIESETENSVDNDETEVVTINNIEDKKTNENVVTPPQNEEPVVNTESVNDATLDSASKANAEKNIPSQSQKKEDTLSIDVVIGNTEGSKTENILSIDAVNNTEKSKTEGAPSTNVVSNSESPKTESSQPTNTADNTKPLITEEAPISAVNQETSENSPQTPEVILVSDVPVIPEEPINEKSSTDAGTNSEPVPVIKGTLPQEIVGETGN